MQEKNINTEIFVVDNASNDGSNEMVRECFPQVRLIVNQENLGFARANNKAIRESIGRYVSLLNSDAFLSGDAIQQMAHLMEIHPAIGIVGANLYSPDGKPQVSHGPLPTVAVEAMSLFSLDKILKTTPLQKLNKPHFETGWVDGACLMVRRNALDQIGLLDETFFMFSEEVDLCCRAYKAGWRVVHLPNALVMHIGGGSTGITSCRILELYRGKLHYFAKHKGYWDFQLLLGLMWLSTLVKIFTYITLRWLTINRLQKDNLWWEVAKGLPSVMV